MKTFFSLITCLIVFGNLYSQNKMSFTATTTELKVNLEASFSHYKILKLNDDNLSVADGLPIQIDCQGAYNFILNESRLLTDNHKTIIKKIDGIEIKNVFEIGFDGRYYHNKDIAANYQVAFSIFENQYLIYIKKDDKEFFLEPLKRFDLNSEDGLYVYYEVKDIIDKELGICGTVDTHNAERGSNVNMAQLTVPGGCKTWYLNFAMDYSFYAQYNSITASLNRSLEVLNLTKLNYKIVNGLAYDVDFQVLQSYILTCSNCNYWPTTNDIMQNASNMSLSVNHTQMFSEVSDSNVFWQANLPPNEYNGLGTMPIPHVCPSEYQNFKARASTLKNFADTHKTRYVLSHELGHNMNSEHSYTPNDIMGYTFNYVNVNNWHPDSINYINTFLSTYTCVYDCVEIACHSKPAQNLNINIDTSAFLVNLSWTPEENITYNTRLYNYTTGLWSDYLSHDDTVSNVQYNLDASPSATCSDKYKVQIIPYCDDISGIVHTTVINVPAACDLANDNFSIPVVRYYPNPIKDIFHISSQNVISKICIYNIIGQRLFEHEVNESTYTMDFSRFENATYFIRVEVLDSASTIKVVKD